MKKGLLGILALTLIFGMAVIGCDDGNGDETFTSTTNETILNDINTLGLVGTSVSSSNVNVATAVIASGKIKITSVGQGSAVITVTENSKNATINVSVSEKGAITIGTITKYSEIEKTIVGTWISQENNSITLTIKADYSLIWYAENIDVGNGPENLTSNGTWNENKFMIPNMSMEEKTFSYSLSADGDVLTLGSLTGTVDYIGGSIWNRAENSGGIQVYNQDGTVFTGNDTGTIWYANGFRETERGDNAVAANINITNGKITNFSLPESINDNFLHSGALGGPGTAKTGVLMITLSSGKNLRLLSENSVGYYFYSKGAKNNSKIDESFEGDINITVGWNCLVISMNGSIVSNSKINNFNDYKWTIIDNVKTFVGSWTKTVSNDVRLLVINDDGTWNAFINDVPYVSDNPGIWSETNKTIGVWYDYTSETHPEPGYVYATYTLSENGDTFTLSGDAELLFGGTEPWTRVNN